MTLHVQGLPSLSIALLSYSTVDCTITTGGNAGLAALELARRRFVRVAREATAQGRPGQSLAQGLAAAAARLRAGAWLTWMCCSTTMAELCEAVYAVPTLSLVTDAGNVRRLDSMLRELGEPIVDYASAQRRASKRKGHRSVSERPESDADNGRGGVETRGGHTAADGNGGRGDLGTGDHSDHDGSHRHDSNRRRRRVDHDPKAPHVPGGVRSPLSPQSSPVSVVMVELRDTARRNSYGSTKGLGAAAALSPAAVDIPGRRAAAASKHLRDEDFVAKSDAGSESDCTWSPSCEASDAALVGGGGRHRRRRVKRGPFSRVVDPPTGWSAAMRTHQRLSASDTDSDTGIQADGRDRDVAVVDAARPRQRQSQGKRQLQARRQAQLPPSAFTAEEWERRKSWIRRNVVCRRGGARFVVCRGRTGAIVSYVSIQPEATVDDAHEAAEALVEQVAVKLGSLTLPACVDERRRDDSDSSLGSDDDVDRRDSDGDVKLLVDAVQLYRPLGEYTRCAGVHVGCGDVCCAACRVQRHTRRRGDCPVPTSEHPCRCCCRHSGVVARRKKQRVDTARRNNNLGSNKLRLRIAQEQLDALHAEHGGAVQIDALYAQSPAGPEATRRRALLDEIEGLRARGVTRDAGPLEQHRVLTLVAQPLFDKSGVFLHADDDAGDAQPQRK
jgi:hypothetical protein